MSSSERLAGDGIAVAVHYAGNEARADEVVEAIRPPGGRAIAVGGDVADEKADGRAFDAVEHEFGGVDVVVHAAGLMILVPVADFDLDDLDRMHRTNIRGTFVVDQQAARTGPRRRRDRQLLYVGREGGAADLRRLRRDARAPSRRSP